MSDITELTDEGAELEPAAELETVPAAEETPEEAVTILSLPPINFAAPGSLKLERHRKALQRAYLDQVEVYNDSVEALETAKKNVVIFPQNLPAHEILKAAMADQRRELRAYTDARDAYHQHLIGRMVTNDGTPVAEALDEISHDAFYELVRGDVESVSIPKAGATS